MDLRYVEQLVDQEQTAALACLLKYAMENLADGRRTLREIVSLETRIRQKGIGSFRIPLIFPRVCCSQDPGNLFPHQPVPGLKKFFGTSSIL